jgi:hypothetical protein
VPQAVPGATTDIPRVNPAAALDRSAADDPTVVDAEVEDVDRQERSPTFNLNLNQTYQNYGKQTLKSTPLGDRVLVKPVESDEEVKGGIIIPDSAKEKPTTAEVLALGNGKKDGEDYTSSPSRLATRSSSASTVAPR